MYPELFRQFVQERRGRINLEDHVKQSFKVRLTLTAFLLLAVTVMMVAILD